jgi:glycosyltransferase involved in cell wall biosynthesis
MNIHSPKTSIIVPIYKVEPYLSDCINSLINQTYHNLEIILVDDGSPDNCGKICDEYAQKDSRIKVIHKENGGLVSARNAGYEAATGDWIMYLDGDDWIELNTCEIIIKHIQDFEIDVVFWNVVQKYGEKSIYRMYWESNENYRIYQDEECKNLSLNTLIYNSGIASAYGKLFKHTFCEKNNLIHNNNLRQGIEGIEFIVRVFYAAQRIIFINQFLNNYRYNPDSISKRIDEQNSKYVIDGFIEIQKFIDKMPDCRKKDFQAAMNQRVLYALIAISMNTYFHTKNKDGRKKKIRKLKHLIKENDIFINALKQVDLNKLDKLRYLIIVLIKYELYFLLFPIAYIKCLMLKKYIIYK